MKIKFNFKWIPFWDFNWLNLSGNVQIVSTPAPCHENRIPIKSIRHHLYSLKILGIFHKYNYRSKSLKAIICSVWTEFTIWVQIYLSEHRYQINFVDVKVTFWCYLQLLLRQSIVNFIAPNKKNATIINVFECNRSLKPRN